MLWPIWRYFSTCLKKYVILEKTIEAYGTLHKLEAAGVSSGLVRLFANLKDLEDLIASAAQALERSIMERPMRFGAVCWYTRG